jgi:phage terminase large subunit
MGKNYQRIKTKKTKWSRLDTEMLAPYRVMLRGVEKQSPYTDYILKGSAGSGKSYAIAQTLIFLADTHPDLHILIIRKKWKDLKKSVVKLMMGEAEETKRKSLLYKYGLMHKDKKKSRVRVTRSEGRAAIYFQNGSSITFTGLPDVNDLKSIDNVHIIWLEEATDGYSEADYNQITLRQRGTSRYKRIRILSFNPVSLAHWIKRRFFDNHKANYKIIETRYVDNPHLEEDDRKAIEAYKTDDPELWRIYGLNEWGAVGGTYFPVNTINKQLRRINEGEVKPVMRGWFEVFRVDNDSNNKLLLTEQYIEPELKFNKVKGEGIKIYKEAENNKDYIIGVDNATVSDKNVAFVIDKFTKEDIATLRMDGPMHREFTEQLYYLGLYYNNALIVCETNHSDRDVVQLEKWKYPNLYRRRSPKHAVSKKKMGTLGFYMTASARQGMLSTTRILMKDNPDLFKDIDFLTECTTFIIHNGKPQADPEFEGAYDDMIMARAIALYTAPKIRLEMDPQVLGNFDISKYPKDIRKDYKECPDDMKKDFIKIVLGVDI